MSSNNEQIQEIEDNIKEARKRVDLGSALERLMSNRDFRKVVLEGYFEKEAVRLVHLKADVRMQGADQQKSILAQIDSIGSFRGYLDLVKHFGELAARSIASDEETLAELHAEAVNHG